MATDYTDTILSIKADVYETSPPGSETTWFPKASSALVSICFDSTGNLCKIISVLGQAPIINSCIKSTSHFIEASALFGTWYDEVNDTTFGVGFANRSDLKAFANAFVQAKKRLEELESPASTTSNLESSIEKSCSENQVQGQSQSASKSTATINSKNGSNCDSFLTFDWHDTLTGTSCNAKKIPIKEDRLLNNNSDGIFSTSCDFSGICDEFSVLPSLPVPNFTLKNDGHEFVVMNVSAPNPNEYEIKTVAQENAYLRKALADASKNVTDWHLELDSHRKLSEALSKAKEEALRVMEEWKSKSYEYQREANIWKERYEKSENMAQNLAEETIANYKQQLKDAISGTEFYKTMVQKKEMELRSLKEQLENQELRPNHSSIAYKKENESLKASLVRAKQQESISTHLANDQWTVMRDTESRLAEGIQKLIDAHTELKRSVKQGANVREQTP